jgi:fructose-specific phosphotransferase system IIA component
MRIIDVLQKESIELNLSFQNKDELLSYIIQLAERSGKIADIESASKAVFDRERIMSTGVGKGIALPHAKTNSVTDSVGALVILNSPIDFEALDGKPVNIIFMLLGRESNVGNHLRLLSKVSRLLNNDAFRSKLLRSETSDEVINIFSEIERED